jgi:hypothetical protein
MFKCEKFLETIDFVPISAQTFFLLYLKAAALNWRVNLLCWFF